MTERLHSTKAQVFYTDFTVATLIIVIAILIYYGYFINVQARNNEQLNDIVNSANIISTSLMSTGTPENWNKDDVKIIGLTNELGAIELNKLLEFQKIDYNATKSLLSTSLDYIMFLQWENETIIDIEGECGIGRKELITNNTLYQCTKPNISIISPKTVVADTRIVSYNNEIIKMIVYAWK